MLSKGVSASATEDSLSSFKKSPELEAIEQRKTIIQKQTFLAIGKQVVNQWVWVFVCLPENISLR